MKYSKTLILLLSLTLLTSAKVCQLDSQTRIYDCQDAKSQGDCTQQGGVQCQYNAGSCSYQNCAQFNPADCVSVLLQGQQCFLNSANKCQGSSSCRDFDSAVRCKSYKNQLCYWDTSSPNPSCVKSSCPQITDVYTCGNTLIDGVPCQWYGNIAGSPQCQIASCGYNSISRCNGTQSGLNYCIVDGQMCRQKTCLDFQYNNQNMLSTNSAQNSSSFSSNSNSSASIQLQTTQIPCILSHQAKISVNVYCQMQSNSSNKTIVHIKDQAQVQTCAPITDCADIKDQSTCQSQFLTNIQCLWQTNKASVGSCRRSTCKDQSTCPAMVNGINCFSSGKACTNCETFGDPCDCLKNQSCAVSFDSVLKVPSCVYKDCTTYTGKSSCLAQNCAWNANTLMCGKTPQDTGFTQVAADANVMAYVTVQSSILLMSTFIYITQW